MAYNRNKLFSPDGKRNLIKSRWTVAIDFWNFFKWNHLLIVAENEGENLLYRWNFRNITLLNLPPYVKGIQEQVNKPPEGEHDKDADNAVDNELLRFRAFFFISGFGDIDEDAPQDDEDRESDDERDKTIQKAA